jgi:hypothetical protein
LDRGIRVRDSLSRPLLKQIWRNLERDELGFLESREEQSTFSNLVIIDVTWTWHDRFEIIWMSLLSILLVSLPSIRFCTRPIFSPCLIRALSMAHPLSSSQVAPPTRAHASVEGTNKQLKEKKNPKTLVPSPGYPLEVLLVENTQIKLMNWAYSCNPLPSSSIIAWESLASSRMNTILGFPVCVFVTPFPYSYSFPRVKAQPRDDITITMPDGTERKGRSWETNPMDIAKEVSKSLSERVVIAKVRNIRLYCLMSPLLN